MKNRQKAAQAQLTSFFTRVGKEVVAEAPVDEKVRENENEDGVPARDQIKKKKKRIDFVEENQATRKVREKKKRGKRMEDEDEEEEEKDDDDDVDVEESKLQVTRKAREKKKGKRIEEDAPPASEEVKLRNQPRRKAKDEEDVDESDDDDERSVFSWLQHRELGVRLVMSALDLSLYKDHYAVDVDPRIGCPFFVRLGHGVLVFGGQNGSLGVANAETGRVIVSASNVYQRWTSEAVVMSPTRVVASSDDGTIRMWRIGDGMEEIAAFDAGVGLYSCDSPSEERTILAATKAGSVCVIDSETMQLASSKDAHKGVVKCVRSAMQNEFLSCGNDKMLKLWDVRSKKEAVTLLEHSMVLNHIDVQGERVLTCDRNGIVKICNLRMPGVMLGQVSLEFKESTMCKPVWRDGKTFAACSPSGNILICSDRRIEQKHDTGKRLQHVCLDFQDPSQIYGVSKYEEICCWTL